MICLPSVSHIHPPHKPADSNATTQQHYPPSKHRLHLCFQEEQETRTTHTHAHTYTNRHTPCVQLECKKFSLCIHEGCLCLSPLLSFFKQIITAFLKKIIIINLKKYKLRHFVPTPNDPKDKKNEILNVLAAGPNICLVLFDCEHRSIERPPLWANGFYIKVI